MARPAWDVKQAREAAGLKQVALARSLGLADKTIERIERSLLAPASTAAADALITALPALPARARFLLRSRIRYADEPGTGLLLPGTAGNYASTPDTAANSIAGDIDLRVKLRSTSWSGLDRFFIYHRSANAGYGFRQHTASPRKIEFMWGDGTAIVFTTSAVAVPFADIDRGWVRATLAVANRVVSFYTSLNGAAWTPLGAPSTPGAVTAIADPTGTLCIGGQPGGEMFDGAIYYAEIRNGIDGPVVAKFDPSASVAATGPRVPATLVSATGETWTMNGTGWAWVEAAA